MLEVAKLHRIARLVPVLIVSGGCVTAKYVPTGSAYAAKPSDCRIEVFSSTLPDRDYEEIGILEAEGSFWKADLEDVIPKLREEACLVGGDALILLSAHKFPTGDEDGIDGADLYAVVTVIRWRQG